MPTALTEKQCKSARHKGTMKELRRARSLSHTQQRRRQAIKDLDTYTHLHLFTKPEKTGRIALSGRGVMAVAGVTGTLYYVLRLAFRDLLGRLPWYRLLQAKSDRTKMFELYLLSVVNAAVLAGFSAYKLAFCERGDTRGVTRVLATSMGYFCHDFFALRHEILSDPPMLIHHLIACTLNYLALRLRQTHKYMPMVALTEMSTVFLSMRWLLKELGQGASKSHKIVLLLFGSSFFVTRIIGLNRELLQVWNDPEMKCIDPLRQVLACLSALNCFWFYKIIRMLQK